MGSVVVDLGAGTGKLTRLLEPTGTEIIAVEPVEAMRRALAAIVPRARVLGGTGETMPLHDASVNAVVAAQAFHWLDGDTALAEIHRVLRPRGRVGLIWNVRDESVDWVAELTEIIDPHSGDAPRYRTGAWREAFDRTLGFGPLNERRFRYEQAMTPDGVVDRVLS